MVARLKSLLLENRTLKQTVLKNTFWMSFGQFVGRLIKAGVVIYAARVLGTAGYGVFSYAVGLAGFFTIFSDIGVSGIMTREGAKDPTLLQRYFSTAFVIKLFLVLFSIILIIFLAPVFTKIPEALPLLPFVALIFAFDGFREFTYAVIRAKEQMQVEAGITIFTNIAISIAGLAAILLIPTAKNLTIGYTIGAGIGLICALYVLRHYLKNLLADFDKTLVKRILTEALPYALMGFLGGIMINTDTIMLGWMADANAVGLYSAAQRPAQLMYLIPGILATAIFPTLSRFAFTDPNRFRTVIEKALKLVFLPAFPIVIGGVIVSKSIILLLFGSQYLGSATAYAILLFTILIIFPANIIGNAVFAINKQKSFVIFLALGVAGNALFNYLLIPKYGIEGASVATIVAQLLSNGFIWWKLRKIVHFRILKHLYRIMGATLIMGLSTWLMQTMGTNLFVNVIVSAGVYAGALFAFKESIIQDIKEAVTA